MLSKSLHRLVQIMTDMLSLKRETERYKFKNVALVSSGLRTRLAFIPIDLHLVLDGG